MTSSPAMGGVTRFKRPNLLLAIMLAWTPWDLAFAQSLDISQYAHTAWRVRDGFAKGAITSLAQTPDGYLWLGTETGLLRFDGVRAVPWQPPGIERLPSTFITRLLVTRDSTLWIATLKGLATWKDGKVTQYPEIGGQIVDALLQDRQGRVWFGAYSPGRLCSIQAGNVSCQGAGSFGKGVFALYEDRGGNLWVSAETGMWRWVPGHSEHYPYPDGVIEINAFCESDSGQLVAATNDGLKQLAGGKLQTYALPGFAGKVRPTSFMQSTDGTLWIGTSQQGLLHVHHGSVDRFGAAEGLSGDNVNRLLEDREGSVWVSTVDGLDGFRKVTIPTIAVKQGLSSSNAWSVQATADGSIWISSTEGLNRWMNGRVTVFPRKSGGPILSMGLDDRGRLWVSTPEGVAYFDGSRFIPVPHVPAAKAVSMAGDGSGKVWILDTDLGLLRWSPGGGVERVEGTTLKDKFGAMVLLADRSRGGVWLGFADGGIAYREAGQVRAAYTVAQGLGGGRVSDLRLGSDGAVWAATEGGLSRVKDGRITTLAGKNGLPCDAVHWSIEDDDGALWLYQPCGLARITRSEVAAWVGDSGRAIRPTVFDSYDGVTSQGALGMYGTHVTKSIDGRIWFLQGSGVGVIDPRHLGFNPIPPPVHIEQVTADGKAYGPVSTASGGLRLPPLVRDLTVDYTALSLAVPEKVHFRFKLEGQDRDWREVANRRQVEYSNLPPGKYRFRVTASNSSGVWNTQGASLDFAVAPAYYQTTWFRALAAAAFLALLWASYRLRVRQLRYRLRTRYQVALAERTRIAQDLHDTLLQGFAGVTLQLKTAELALPEQPDVAAATLARVQRLAGAALREARESVWDMRSAELDEIDVVEALHRSALAARTQTGPSIEVTARGERRRLSPRIELVALRIGREAMANAFRHAEARHIDIELEFGSTALRLEVKDDGRGITPEDREQATRDGHLGITGMQDRAQRAGGRCEVIPRHTGGTAVILTLPLDRSDPTA